ncbi:sulfatase-like hydrolase/transferase [Zobellia galactanivorans]|uniref:Sulfatase, family S1-30 n=1 Tax=Zobellia galactanivorans (strain DSM 12802 / CCUG 47099 / CIP 106680 / NCIMB 13871 / Dsij) TaxID=63186 RepID=G0L8Q7_ZOBGA|nr:sulfatase-like hydrolase/transferase [Zobellia galactanivorans]CAZ97767.1 Sulfatase, family S1-30 [Zobellia galactanivorans]
MKVTNHKTLWALLGSIIISSNAMAQEKPNIILLYADDISARELPIYGSTVWSPPKGGNSSDIQYRAKTPVLNQLAEEGCYIKTAWAATVCGPSRAMMMTGRYAHLHKWWHNKDKGKAPDGKGSWNLYDSSPHSIANVAKAGGYATFWAGKTQMNIEGFAFDEGCFTPGEGSYNKAIHTTDFRLETRKVNGKKKIFNADTNKEIHKKSYVQSGWYWKPHVQLMNHPGTNKKLVWWPNTKKAKKEFGLNTFGPDVELDFIFEFMERKQKEGEPFFVYHTSHLGHDAWDFLHPGSGNKWPGTPKINWDGTKYSRIEPHITGDKGVYNTHGTVTESGIHHHINYLDYQVWQYINKFKELGIENNTIFIFCADNGTSGYGKSSPISQKGTHVPLIIYAPGMHMTKKGLQDVLVNISDMLPTIADIAQVEIPDSYEINGESLLPFLTTDKKTHRNWIYAYHKETQIVRGNLVLKDGNNVWYDVSRTPEDLISFPKITDWGKVSQAHRKERDELLRVIPQYDLHETAHDAPVNGIGPVTPLILKK